jgi:ribonuclease E
VEAEPEIVEEAEPVEDTKHEEIPAESRQHLQPGENGGRRKRRRRRRGGRDRDRSLQSDQRQEQGSPTMQTAADAGGQEARSAEAVREIDEPNSHTVAPPQNGESLQNEQQGQFGEGHRRKRRRRRGRRGGRDRENSGGRADNGAPSFVEAPQEGRFGQPDEIDTTPRDEPGTLTKTPPAPVTTPEAIPNAASTPVWSLKAERAEKPPKPLEEKVSAPASVETAREAPTPPQSTKKGWWQRAFRTD